MCVIYTDGSYNSQCNIGAWAVITKDHEITGTLYNADPFYCEAYAIYQAILHFKDKKVLHIYTDSQGAVRMLTDKRKVNRERNRRKHHIIGKIYDLLDKVKCKVFFHKVKAHDGDEWNDKADKSAKNAKNEILCIGSVRWD